MQKTIFLVLSILILVGCSTTKQRTELQHIAKDWCMVIRASQIIPVYPLTEDLHVGDIFLVQRTVDEQHQEYEQRGFLPLDNLIYRMDPTGFYQFYDLSFAHGEPEIELPADWLGSGQDISWKEAPKASFPTYSFAVKSGGGINIGVPVQGVPIGLSLLGSDAAQGTITIGDGKTYGLDTITLYQDNLLPWERLHHDFLLNFASKDGKKNYIRVISRVYLMGRMNVTLTTSGAQSAGLTVGAPKPVELLTIKAAKTESGVEAATVENYTESLTKLNTYINKVLTESAGKNASAMLPGGTVKIVAASSRGVSMDETFRRPLVIGYLGFDMAIGPDGMLGPPIPTHAVLNQQIQPPIQTAPKLQLFGDARLVFTYNIIRVQGNAGNEYAILLRNDLDSLGAIVPELYPVPIFSAVPNSDRIKKMHVEGSKLRSEPSVFSDVTKYRGKLRDSITLLKRAPQDESMKTKWLELTRIEMKRMNDELNQRRALIDRANRYADQF